MAMDVFERLNRRFGTWYEGLFGNVDNRDMRPRDVLRRILIAMEDARKEGLDGQVYVPNVYTVRVAVGNDEERDYLRTFLSAEELAAAVFQTIEQHGYRLRGGLIFTVEEVPTESAAAILRGERLVIQCRFDPNAGVAGAMGAEPPAVTPPKVSTQAAVASGDVRAYSAQSPEMVAPSTVPANAVGQLGMLNARGVEEDVFPVTPKGVRIGRGVQMGNDIILDDSMVSKKHCHITYENGSFLLGDDNSTNGTYLNEMPVRAGSQVPLRSGDTIRLGTTRLCFKTITKAPAQGQPPTVPTPRTPPVADSVEEWNQAETRFDFSHAQKNRAPSPVAFRLIGENGELYPLASKMTIGRALTGDITLIGEGVASQHARLTIDDGALYVEDLGTTGGTFVNGEQIPANFPVVLYNGDRLVCGSVSLLVEKFVIGKDS